MRIKDEKDEEDEEEGGEEEDPDNPTDPVLDRETVKKAARTVLKKQARPASHSDPPRHRSHAAPAIASAAPGAVFIWRRPRVRRPRHRRRRDERRRGRRVPTRRRGSSARPQQGASAAAAARPAHLEAAAGRRRRARSGSLAAGRTDEHMMSLVRGSGSFHVRAEVPPCAVCCPRAPCPVARRRRRAPRALPDYARSAITDHASGDGPNVVPCAATGRVSF